MTQPSRFWDKHAKKYAKHPIANKTAYQRKLKLTQDYLSPDIKILEHVLGDIDVCNVLYEGSMDEGSGSCAAAQLEDFYIG